MQRSNWPWVSLTVALALVAGWMALDNRELRAELSRAREPVAAGSAAAVKPSDRGEGSAAPAGEEPRRQGGLAALARAFTNAAPPTLSEPPTESRMERRARRSAEISAMFGRLEGESEDEYRQRVMPLVSMALERPRQRALEMRREAEQKAGVTAEQSAKLDQAFAAAYGEVIDYTNAAIAEGQLSPYQRNVSGWLGFAGGLGGILGGVESNVATILRPEQVRAMSDAGFEWGEFLGVSAPWEKLRAPPPPTTK